MEKDRIRLGSLELKGAFLGVPGAGQTPLTPFPSAAAAAAAAHFSFCRSLLEHTVSAENLSYRLQRSPGTSLTWHDGRSQRGEGSRAIKLLRQPGTEGSQVLLGSRVRIFTAGFCGSGLCKGELCIVTPPRSELEVGTVLQVMRQNRIPCNALEEQRTLLCLLGGKWSELG